MSLLWTIPTTPHASSCSVRISQSALRTSLLDWQPQTHWSVEHLPAEFHTWFAAPENANLFSKRHSTDWQRLPPVTEEELLSFAHRLKQTTPTGIPQGVVVDHYAHIRLLQNVIQELAYEGSIPLAISLRLKEDGFGVRMGHDLQNLTQAIVRCPNFRSLSLWGDFRWLTPEESSLGLQLLLTAQKLLTEMLGQECPLLLYAMPGALRKSSLLEESQLSTVTQLLPFAQWWSEILNHTHPSSNDHPLIRLESVVISRPSLTSVVLQAGENVLQQVMGEPGLPETVSPLPKNSVHRERGHWEWSLEEDPLATLRQTTSDLSLWKLSETAGDLRIGRPATLILRQVPHSV